MSKKNKLTFPKDYIVVIGKPICTLEELGLDCCKHNTLRTDERYLPKVLVELEVFPSISEVRKNRKELVKTLDEMDWITLRFGHRVVDIIVGD